MIYNFITLVGILIFSAILRITIRHSCGKLLLKLLSVILISFKIIEYIVINISGRFVVPVEISTISYFVFSFIFIFDIKKGYHIASFFGVVSGIGFFLFYSVFGSLIPHQFNAFSHIISIYAHGVLFIGGSYLFCKNSFVGLNKTVLLVVMLLILCHASIFYMDSYASSTFIYYLVKTEFLPKMNNFWTNYIIRIVFYVVLFLAFMVTIHFFFRWNKQLHINSSERIKSKLFINE